MDELVQVPILENFKIPVMKDYDGTTDPQQHLVMFKTKMTILGVNDVMLCKVFPNTLTGSTLTWFVNLPLRSVTNFVDLSRKFMTQFAASQIHKKRSVALFSIQQQPNETLKEYLWKFNEATI